MKKTLLLLTLLGGWIFNAGATVSGPDNIVYGTITLGGVQIMAADTNYFVAARFKANGPPIATYTMGSLPSAGNNYSLRISVESVGSAAAPNAALASQLIYLDVDDQSGIRAQTSFRVGKSSAITLLNFGASTFSGTSGSLNVSIQPPAAVAAGAGWLLDGLGAVRSNGVIATNLATGIYNITFTPVAGFITPTNQTVTVSSGVTRMVNAIYAQPNGFLTLLTNGYGSIQHAAWPVPPVIGNSYKLTAVPKPKNVFVNWIGGTNQPYSVLSTSPNYTFIMQSNLVLEANFVTNVYMLAKGNYRGLFGPTNVRHQMDSGSFLFTVSQTGTLAGRLDIGGTMVPISGKIDVDGSATIISKPVHGVPSLTTSLQLDFVDQAVSGAVTDGTFMSQLTGNHDVFSPTVHAGGFIGQYTLVIPGTTNPVVGPFGNSYGVVKVAANGVVTFNGSLADGTPIAQSSVVSQDGYWPMYISLYGGKGSLWGWNNFANHTITSPNSLSWINSGNSSHTAAYRSGFTNLSVSLSGGLYSPTQTLPPSSIVTMTSIDPSFTLSVSNIAANSSALTMKTNKVSGVITGGFANPDDPTRMIRYSGVILQGQTNAQGYFLTPSQTSGTFNYGPAQ